MAAGKPCPEVEGLHPGTQQRPGPPQAFDLEVQLKTRIGKGRSVTSWALHKRFSMSKWRVRATLRTPPQTPVVPAVETPAGHVSSPSRNIHISTLARRAEETCSRLLR